MNVFDQTLIKTAQLEKKIAKLKSILRPDLVVKTPISHTTTNCNIEQTSNNIKPTKKRIKLDFQPANPLSN